ncbi:UNVERIFIED_ORG: peptide/nickel transport system substrate-binding protein [Martelella mediterranea]
MEGNQNRTGVMKPDRRRFLQGAAALGIGLGAAASPFGGAAFAQTPRRGGLLRAGMNGGSSTDSLDPATTASAVMFQFSHLWGEQIVQLSPEGELQPALAEEWNSSEDAKTWRFRIRKGVEFHNGKKLTPEDVAATIRRHSDEKSQSGALGLLENIVSVAVDGDNVVVKLAEPNVELPYLLEDYHLMVQPNGGIDDPTAGIGTGPYRISFFEPGVRVGGERFKNYWRDDRGFADQVEIIVINDNTARTAALRSGQVDIINHIEPKTVSLLERVNGVTIKSTTGRGHQVFPMHCNTPPFDNNDLRLALKYAVDRQQMLDMVLMGFGSLGNDFPINAAYPLFTEIEQRPYDPDRARYHYKKSGNDQPVVFHTSESVFSGAISAAELFQQTAQAAGIPFQIKREPADGYWTSVWNEMPFCASYWGGRSTQDQMYTTAYMSGANWNDTRFSNPKFDRMLLEARAQPDPELRKELYFEMGSIVRDEGGALIPLFNDFIDAIGPRVAGWAPDPAQSMMGGYALAKCWVAE